MGIARLTFTRREADDDLDRQRQSGGRTSHDSLSFVNGVVWMRRIGEIFPSPKGKPHMQKRCKPSYSARLQSTTALLTVGVYYVIIMLSY